MSGTKAGSRKSVETNRAKYGPDFYQKTGALGGSAPHKIRGFQAMTPERLSEVSRKGGLTSRRTKSGRNK